MCVICAKMIKKAEKDINEINNLSISSIQVYTLEDSLKYDEEHLTKYTEK